MSSAPPPSRSLPKVKDWRLPLLAVMGIGAVYVLWHLDRGWMPLDDGMLGHAAQRLNAGELPHRDFDEAYTGGLTWLNAWTFRVLGDRLWNLRVVLFAVFLAWVPAVQYIATRFLRPWHAAAVTALSIVWTLPNYGAAMPSWYNLFFATFGVAALLRYIEDRRRRWLFVAGLAGGISVLFKIVGLFFIAAGLLSLVHLARGDADEEDAPPSRPAAYPAFISAALLVFVAGLVGVVAKAFHPAEVVNFVLPGALLAAALLRNEWRPRAATSRPFRDLAARLIPFVAGAVLPIAIFLVPFMRGGGVDDLIRGVFILPQRRFEFSSTPPLPLVTMVGIVPVALAMFWLRRRRAGLPVAALVVIGVVLGVLLWVTGVWSPAYRSVWYVVRALPVLTVAAAAWHLACRPHAEESSADRARLAVVASTLACCSLVQFPYSAPAYFCYMAPLLFLAWLPWIPRAGLAVTQVAGFGAAFLVAFAVMRVNGSPLQTMGLRYEPPWEMTALESERAGIQVPLEHARVYSELIASLRQHARGGYAWATPDAPEIYYLSGLKNPTRSFYEFLDDSPDHEASVLHALDERGVTAVVLNRLPFFSPQISRSMFTALSRRYPRGREIGPFVLLWRE